MRRKGSRRLREPRQPWLVSDLRHANARRARFQRPRHESGATRRRSSTRRSRESSRTARTRSAIISDNRSTRTGRPSIRRSSATCRMRSTDRFERRCRRPCMSRSRSRPSRRPESRSRVRAASGSPALLTKSVAAALGAVNPDITMTFRPLAEQVNSSLIQERVVAMMSGLLRRTGAAARRTRSLRRHVVCGESPANRARDPNGARRRARRRRSDSCCAVSANSGARRCRGRQRHQLDVGAIRLHAGLSVCSRAIPLTLAGRSSDAGRDWRAGRLAARAPRVTHRPGARAARRMTRIQGSG